MPCYRPIHAYVAPGRSKNGKRAISFTKRGGFSDLPLTLPCGSCVGCRLDRARQWSFRIMHEASQHEDNCFITLTYDDEHLPRDGSLVVEDFQNFMKRLRDRVAPKKIRFFHCGEYGEQDGRPHYHAILFGLDFPDRMRYNDGGRKAHSSEMLGEVWDKGFNMVGDLTPQSAAYVARYCIKKSGVFADSYDGDVDETTGEVARLKREYVTMSRRPGIGRGWYDKYSDDVFPSDSIVVQGKEYLPPSYYTRVLEETRPALHRQVKLNREHRPVDPDRRLRDRERAVAHNLKILSRRYV